MKLLPALALTVLPAVAWAGSELPNVPPEPAVKHLVTEDDATRIEELRVRGQTQSIVVTSKIRGLRGSQYEVIPANGARDPSVPGQANGQRVWQLFSY